MACADVRATPSSCRNAPPWPPRGPAGGRRLADDGERGQSEQGEPQVAVPARPVAHLVLVTRPDPPPVWPVGRPARPSSACPPRPPPARAWRRRARRRRRRPSPPAFAPCVVPAPRPHWPCPARGGVTPSA